MTKLQLALDVLTLEEAIAFSEKLADYVDIIELGTPLIKEESAAESIMVMKKIFPKKTILADFKTMDTGNIEAGMAFDAGADIMTVCGTADDNTIKAAIGRAKKSKKKVMVDLIGVQDKLKRAMEISKFKPSYICIHTAIDENECPLEGLKNIKSKVKIPIAVAGGINKTNIKQILKYNPEIIIVGRVLTKAKNPVKEAIILNRLIKRKPSKEKHKKTEPFTKITHVLEEEIKNTLNKVNSKNTDNFIKILLKSRDKQIFVSGEGRSGLVGEAFAMRLMHLGFQSHFIGEPTTPSIQKNDLLISFSGSGSTQTVLERVIQAKKQKALTIAITANKKSRIAKESKIAIEIPAKTDSKMEPLGSLFEQTSFIYSDSIIVSLMSALGKNASELKKLHTNL